MNANSNGGLPRDLDTIAADIHALDLKSGRDYKVAIGNLLIEAYEGPAGEYGNWGDWIKNNFDFGYDTATNYMRLAKVAKKLERVPVLPIPDRVLYILLEKVDENTEAENWEDSGDLAVTVDALFAAAEAKGKHPKDRKLTGAEAKRVIKLARLRIAHGDYPDATLLAINDLYDDYNMEDWESEAIDALKTAHVDTDDAAVCIVYDFYRKRLTEIADCDVPAWLDHESIDLLNHVGDPKHLSEIMRRLAAKTKPSDAKGVNRIIRAVVTATDEAATGRRDDTATDDAATDDAAPAEDAEDAEDVAAAEEEIRAAATDDGTDADADDAEPTPKDHKPKTKETKTTAATEKARGDVAGRAEIERLNASVAELSTKVRQLESGKTASDQEVERLEAENKKLVNADPADVLIARLKRYDTSYSIVTLNKIIAALGVDPRKLNAAELEGAA